MTKMQTYRVSLKPDVHSSKIRTIPLRVHKSRTPSKKPGSGGIFVGISTATTRSAFEAIRCN